MRQPPNDARNRGTVQRSTGSTEHTAGNHDAVCTLPRSHRAILRTFGWPESEWIPVRMCAHEPNKTGLEHKNIHVSTSRDSLTQGPESQRHATHCTECKPLKVPASYARFRTLPARISRKSRVPAYSQLGARSAGTGDCLWPSASSTQSLSQRSARRPVQSARSAGNTVQQARSASKTHNTARGCWHGRLPLQ